MFQDDVPGQTQNARAGFPERGGRRVPVGSLVLPVQQEHILGQLWHQLGVVVQDVGPEHDAPTMLGRELPQPQDVLQV